MRKSRSSRDSNNYLDLDVDVPDVEEPNEENQVLHNRKKVRKERVGKVLPSDAHKNKEFDGENALEEEAIALQTSKEIRKRERESDFGLPRDVEVSASAARASQPIPIEVVEREYDSLSSDERLAMLRRDSPEVEKLLVELKANLSEIRQMSDPLRKMLHERKIATKDKQLVSFLEMKVQLMISYCMHIMFYLLLKLEGKQVKGHPVLARLVELRVYFEKVHPLQVKLQYSLNRLLSGAVSAKANTSALRPVRESDSGLFDPQKRPVSSNREALQHAKARREAEELEKEELSAMTRVQKRKPKIDLSEETQIREGYHEEGDQFFQQLVTEEEDDEQPVPLIERLRGRKIAAPSHVTPSESGDDEESLAEDDGDFEALVEQERIREAESAKVIPTHATKSREVDRRQIGKKIESHRGLTKSRPKDRKTPRTSQRRKYERGLQVAKAQTKSAAAEPVGGFIGTTTFKSNVVHSTKF
jgi:U3 small nucleolar RNA-associated protein 3